ncbi:TIGR02221 family CRISPR-associated protein [Gammaproteobacteria bacterium]
MALQVSFLGKSQIHSQTGYRTVRYEFEDGETVETPFFGLALARKTRPDRLILLGTSGSMWDTLVENQATDDQLEQPRLQLMDAVRDNAVTDTLLAPLASLVEARIGCPVDLRVIPYGYHPKGQINILKILADSVTLAQHGEVVLDVTHGLRHLPMLALVAAFYLEHTSQVKVVDILYGALEMASDGVAPVLSLKGLLTIMDWVQALAAFDQDGNYGPFVPLLQQAGVPDETVGHLRRAAYAERVFNHELARNNLLAFRRDAIENGLPGEAALFTDPLAKRLEWVNKPAAQRLAAIARERLTHGDYVRAAIAACSGFIASMVKPNERLSDYATQDLIEKEFWAGLRGDPEMIRDHRYLKRLRNALAHGTQASDDEIRRTLADEERLKARLQSLFDRLLAK